MTSNACGLSCWFESIDWTPEAITAAATVVLACLTFILAFGTIFLWIATRKLVRGAEKNSERQLRAYISIVSGDVGSAEINGAISTPPSMIAIGKRPASVIQFLNSGQTPAYDMEFSGYIEVVD
jgi:hypothetical protein